MQNLNLQEAQFILQVMQDLNLNLEKILVRQLRTNDSLTEVGRFILGIGFDSFEIEVDYFYHKHHVCIGTSTETITMPVGVSDHEFGWCKVGVDGLLKQYSRHMVNVLASFMTEMADSLLYQSKMASIKQTLMERMRKEFMDPVFEDAVSKAISHLYEIVEFEDLVLVYRESISLDHPERLDYLIFFKGKLIHSQENPHKGMDKLLGVEGDSIFHWPLNRYREFVECQTLVQEKILSALDPELVLGTFVFSSNHEVTNFSRDVLKMFVNGIHEILNEYTREKQNLSCNFPGTVVRRLLRTPNYHRKYLSAREAEVGILFADISGFTRISEQVFKNPALIARFVEEWAQKMIRILYANHGIYDKLIGDCIIGLFGAPFFDLLQAEVLLRLISTAKEFVVQTREMNEEPWIKEHLVNHPGMEPLGVAIGINYAPAFVGQIGPDKTYTGLSQGMNNTARLQGLATRDQILIPASLMSVARPLIKDCVILNEESMPVKNVVEPLRFHRIIVT